MQSCVVGIQYGSQSWCVRGDHLSTNILPGGALVFNLSPFAVLCFPGGAGAIATLIHDGFMNPIDGEHNE